MGVSILERIQAKIELFRLEQRYTRRRHRRSTFVSNAVYVDGEYIYNTPNTTGSSTATYNSSSGTPSSSEPTADPASMESIGGREPETPAEAKQRKKLNRWSSMPGFGGSMSRATPARPSAHRGVTWEAEGRRNSLSETSRDL